MAGIRFTKGERTAIRWAFGYVGASDPPAQPKGYEANEASVLEKLDKCEVAPPKKAAGISVATAVKEFQGVLGRRLVLPPNPGAGWYAQMSNRLAALGMTPELCRAAAMQAGHEWQGNIKAESIIRQADSLIHNYTASEAPVANDPRALDLDEEEM